MRIILVSLALVATALPAFAADSLKATVNGMACDSCAQGIEKSLSRMDATRAVFVDLKGRVVLVEAKAGKSLDQKAISAVIVDAGYDVVKIEPSSQSVAEIKAAAKGARK